MDEINRIISQKIKAARDTFPALLLEEHFKIQPQLKEKYKERQIKLYIEDTRYHLSYLAESIAANEPVLFNEYLAWAKTFFANLPVTDEEIILNLELLRDKLAGTLPAEYSIVTNKFINEGISRYKSQNTFPPTFIVESNPLMKSASDYLEYLVDGNKKAASDLIMKMVNDGTSIKDLYMHLFQVTQKETGRLWQMSRISVAQEHFITAATQMIMSQLYPYLFTNKNRGKSIIVSCINGELHELAPRMVADLFEMDGWNSFYFGANTPKISLIKAIDDYKPDIIAISATMTFNIDPVSELIESIKDSPNAKHVKILVGGHPFNLANNLWKSVGADGFAIDANSAIQRANELLNL